MKIAIWNPTSFVGSNFCNYFMLNPEHELVLFIPQEVGPSELRLIAGPLSAKMRSSLQITEARHYALDTDLRRLTLEEVDIVLCFDVLPKQFKTLKNIIYIGKDYTETGSSRAFIYSNAFGPRQNKSDAIPAFLFESKTLDIKNAIYIKEMYDNFEQFLSSSSKTYVVNEDPVTTEDFVAALNGKASTKMQISIAHTLRWYNSNAWFDLK